MILTQMSTHLKDKTINISEGGEEKKGRNNLKENYNNIAANLPVFPSHKHNLGRKNYLMKCPFFLYGY